MSCTDYRLSGTRRPPVPGASPNASDRARLAQPEWASGQLSDRLGERLPDRWWQPATSVLAALWPVICWIAAVLLVGGLLVGVGSWMFRAVQIPLPDLQSLPVLGGAIAQPGRVRPMLVAMLLIALVSWWAHAIQTSESVAGDPLSDYALRRVSQLRPDDLVPRFLPGVYLPRRDATGVDADELARRALQAAAGRRPGAPLGVCVFGEAGQGKTRLAWEAVAATLPGWHLLRWPHAASEPFDFSRVRGRRVVLWLDGLQDYAYPSEAPVLEDLIRLLPRVRARLVVVATCRDGADEARGRALLGGLLDQLRAIRPAAISAAEADSLARALGQRRNAETNPPSGDLATTPGVLTLDLARLRVRGYPALPEDARRVLRALKLLRSAGIYACPERRTWAVAQDLFGLPADRASWQAARDALVASGLVRVVGSGRAGARQMQPVADLYLERLVAEYPPSGVSLAADWPRLQMSLVRHGDANALCRLGNAFGERLADTQPSSVQWAEDCYRAALSVWPRRLSPVARAAAHNNLALTLVEQAARGEGSAAERARQLAAAVTAYRAALKTYRRKGNREDWARTQTNLGLALREQARWSAEPWRSQLLRRAMLNVRAVHLERSPEVAPTTRTLAQAALDSLTALPATAGMPAPQARRTTPLTPPAALARPATAIAAVGAEMAALVRAAGPAAQPAGAGTTARPQLGDLVRRAQARAAAWLQRTAAMLQPALADGIRRANLWIAEARRAARQAGAQPEGQPRQLHDLAAAAPRHSMVELPIAPAPAAPMEQPYPSAAPQPGESPRMATVAQPHSLAAEESSWASPSSSGVGEPAIGQPEVPQMSVPADMWAPWRWPAGEPMDEVEALDAPQALSPEPIPEPAPAAAGDEMATETGEWWNEPAPIEIRATPEASAAPRASEEEATPPSEPLAMGQLESVDEARMPAVAAAAAGREALATPSATEAWTERRPLDADPWSDEAGPGEASALPMDAAPAVVAAPVEAGGPERAVGPAPTPEEESFASMPGAAPASARDMGSVLLDRARLARGAERARLLAEAAAAYRVELRTDTHDQDPMGWARTQLNLVVALLGAAELATGNAQVHLLSEAAYACHAALDAYTAQAQTDWQRFAADLLHVVEEAQVRTEANGDPQTPDMLERAEGRAAPQAIVETEMTVIFEVDDETFAESDAPAAAEGPTPRTQQ
jgi:hypothetical protein